MPPRAVQAFEDPGYKVIGNADPDPRRINVPHTILQLATTAELKKLWYKVRVSLEDRFARQAQNESLFREVNERIAQLGKNAEAWSPDGTVEFMCECGEEGGCGQRVRVPLDIYERVRSQDDRFVVRPGHETPEIESAVEWTEDYVVVDKIPAAEQYVADDPRGAGSH